MSDLPKKAEDKVNTFGVILIGIVSAVLVWVSVVALQAYYKNTAGPVEEMREAEGKSAEVRALNAQWTSELQKTEYSDANKGLLKRLPIDRAMELVVRDANEGAESLVPRLGPHDVPTVPAEFGKPADDATVPPPDEIDPMADPSADPGTADGSDAAAGAGAAGTADGVPPAPGRTAPAPARGPAPTGGTAPAPPAGADDATGGAD